MTASAPETEKPPTGEADLLDERPRVRAGRPTKAAAAERDGRLIEIATRMFLDLGFEATSIDRLAETAQVGKATLYARYADKGALFADVLQRRILEVYGPLEAEFGEPLDDEDLVDTLQRVGDRLVSLALSEESVTLGRIMAAQGPRFPRLAQLAITEGYGRQLALIEKILSRYAVDPRYRLDDVSLAAELFLSLVLGRATRAKIYGLTVEPDQIQRRTQAAVHMFVRGIAA